MDNLQDIESGVYRIENPYRINSKMIEFLEKTAKIAIKIGFIVVREIGYMQTAIITFPKERWGIYKDYKKLTKLALPIIFGIGTCFLWNTPIGISHLLFILLPSWLLYVFTTIQYVGDKCIDCHFNINSEGENE